jgi:hypothetical protein
MGKTPMDSFDRNEWSAMTLSYDYFYPFIIMLFLYAVGDLPV